jgi:hypothetical protein
MKWILLLALSIQAMAADEFTLTPTDPEVDLSPLHKEIKIQGTATRVQKGYLSVTDRDLILNKHLRNQIKDMDEFDRDILYKSLISYDKKTLLKKYPFLKNVNLKEFKNDLL